MTKHRGSFTPGQQSPVRASTGDLDVRWSDFGVIKVAGPVWRMTTLPVGAVDKHSDVITKYTPDWARIGYEKMSDRSTMITPGGEYDDDPEVENGWVAELEAVLDAESKAKWKAIAAAREAELDRRYGPRKVK
jgi:hypothetical protein